MLKNETTNSANQIERLSLTNKIRSWFLDHPSFNPYRFSLKRNCRILTSNMRLLPDFLVIGSSKSGTTSFHYYITQHPNIVAERNIHFLITHHIMVLNGIEHISLQKHTKIIKN